MDNINYQKIGDEYYQKNDFGNAIENYKKALEIDATNQAIYNSLSQAYKAIGENEIARKYYEKGLDQTYAYRKIMAKMEAKKEIEETFKKHPNLFNENK